ncbi:MAG: thioredoxin domain-containing protein [Candidatus Acidiferrales bacterium]
MNVQWQSSRVSSASICGKKAAWTLAVLGILAIALASHAAPRTARQLSGGSAKADKPVHAPVKAYGSPSAPITMEVFTDYECPSCRALYEGTLRPLLADYVASGKVYLVHHDFPLSMHKYSGQAARWADTAAEFGQFDAVEAALYDNQSSWETDGNMEKYISAAMPPSDFKRIEEHMRGCDPPGPTAGAATPPHPCPVDVYIQQDITLGNQIPVKATPTYVITYKGQHLPPGSGPVSWEILKQFFDSLLSQQ